MSVLGGCEEKNKTPVLEERICPNCGDEAEVFTVKGRLIDDFVCTCGYVFHREEQFSEGLQTTSDLQSGNSGVC